MHENHNNIIIIMAHELIDVLVAISITLLCIASFKMSARAWSSAAQGGRIVLMHSDSHTSLMILIRSAGSFVLFNIFPCIMASQCHNYYIIIMHAHCNTEPWCQCMLAQNCTILLATVVDFDICMPQSLIILTKFRIKPVQSSAAPKLHSWAEIMTTLSVHKRPMVAKSTTDFILNDDNYYNYSNCCIQ